MATTILFGAAVFVIVKEIFMFLSWLKPEEPGAPARQRLDSIWDTLVSSTPEHLIRRIFRQIILRASFNRILSVRGILIVTLSSAIINSLMVLLGLTIMMGTALRSDEVWRNKASLAGFTNAVPEGPDREWTIQEVGFKSQRAFYAFVFREMTWPTLDQRDSYDLLSYIFAAVILDWLSLLITLGLISHLLQSKTKFSVALHILADLLLAVIVVFIIMAFCDIYGKWRMGWLARASLFRELEVFYEMLVSKHSVYLIMNVLLGATALLPTAIYLVILLIVLAGHYIPRRCYSFATLVIFRLATDNKPLLSQLGTVAGAVAGICVVLWQLLSEL